MLLCLKRILELDTFFDFSNYDNFTKHNSSLIS